MGMIEELKELGVDVEDAVQRFMGNEGLFTRMVKKLPPSIKDLHVVDYVEKGDYETALNNAHTLKGVMGNLSVTPLFNAYNDAVALLRENKPEEAKKRVEEIFPVQEQIVACIEKYL